MLDRRRQDAGSRISGVLSLNVPIPGTVKHLIADLHPLLLDFDRIREEHTLVLKRLGNPGPNDSAVVQQRVRRLLEGAPTVEARVSGIETFEAPPTGRAPVVYLAVESPGLVQLHHRLVNTLDPVPDIEGDEYVPHITLASGGSDSVTRTLRSQSIDPVTWTVRKLVFWDAQYNEQVGMISLPA